MKKILLSLLFIKLFISNIYADDFTNEGSYQLSLSYTKAPTYYVKIPTTVDISNQNTQFSFYVKGEIYADATLNIDFQDSTLISNDKENIEVVVSQDKKDFLFNELSDEYLSSNIYLTHMPLDAGQYVGILNVMISLKGGI